MTTKYAQVSTKPACDAPRREVEPFLARHVTEVEQAPEQPWLIDELWFAGGVGILGGHPKLGKTFVAVELALAVAAGGAAFGRHPAPLGGPVLFYGPEDGLCALRRRFEALALTRRHALLPHPMPPPRRGSAGRSSKWDAILRQRDPRQSTARRWAWIVCRSRTDSCSHSQSPLTASRLAAALRGVSTYMRSWAGA
jgi:hypothetical protein